MEVVVGVNHIGHRHRCCVFFTFFYFQNDNNNSNKRNIQRINYSWCNNMYTMVKGGTDAGQIASYSVGDLIKIQFDYLISVSLACFSLNFFCCSFAKPLVRIDSAIHFIIMRHKNRMWNLVNKLNEWSKWPS